MEHLLNIYGNSVLMWCVKMLIFLKLLIGDCVVTNPPFSILPKVLERLRALNKPFVIIMPTYTMNTQYFQRLFKDIQVIVPPKRIQFKKLVDGVGGPDTWV